MTNIYLAVDSIPARSPQSMNLIVHEAEDKIRRLKAPGTYKKQESIDKWLAAEATKIRNGIPATIERSAFSATAGGEVISVSWVLDAQPHTYHRLPDFSEATFLKSILEQMATFISFPVSFIGPTNWDLTFFIQRCIILGLELPRWMPRPYDRLENVLYMWTGDRHSDVTLEKLGWVLGFGNELGPLHEIQGKDVPRLVREGLNVSERTEKKALLASWIHARIV